MVRVAATWGCSFHKRPINTQEVILRYLYSLLSLYSTSLLSLFLPLSFSPSLLPSPANSQSPFTPFLHNFPTLSTAHIYFIYLASFLDSPFYSNLTYFLLSCNFSYIDRWMISMWKDNGARNKIREDSETQSIFNETSHVYSRLSGISSKKMTALPSQSNTILSYHQERANFVH